MKLQSLLAGILVLGLGTIPVTFAADAGSDREQIEQMGAPLPGTAGDQESTQKQRDPAKDQNSDQNAQVTVGGAKSSVTGEIRKIQDEYFFVKDQESGDEIRLLVNKDTNLDCGAASKPDSSSEAGITKRQAGQDQSAEASKRQKEQGQKQNETAMGSGFSIGSCSFNTGDRIKAEVDDTGRVTMLKFVSEASKTASESARPGESAGTGELAMPGRQDMPGQLDMTGKEGYPPKQYAILPIPQGKFKEAGDHALLHQPLKNAEGKTVGTLNSLIMDSDTGQVEYAVVLLEDKKTLREVPWKHIKTKQGPQGKELVLSKNYQLDPDLTGKATQDRSPEIAKMLRDMEHAIAGGDLREDSAQESSGSSQGKSALVEAPKDVKGQIVRGRVLEIDGQMFLIKERSGKETRMRVDQKTQKGQVNLRDDSFKVGDRVEAYVTPDGHAFSISLTRTQGGMPGDPEAGG